MEEGQFRPPRGRGSKNPEPIHVKFAHLITSIVRPRVHNTVVAANAEWGGHMG